MMMMVMMIFKIKLLSYSQTC